MGREWWGGSGRGLGPPQPNFNMYFTARPPEPSQVRYRGGVSHGQTGSFGERHHLPPMAQTGAACPRSGGHTVSLRGGAVLSYFPPSVAHLPRSKTPRHPPGPWIPRPLAAGLRAKGILYGPSYLCHFHFPTMIPARLPHIFFFLTDPAAATFAWSTMHQTWNRHTPPHTKDIVS